MIKATLNLLATLLLISCNKNPKNEAIQDKSSKANEELIGRSATLTFPEMKAVVHYVNDSTLHWKTTDKNGIVAEGDEKMNYEKLSENLHFLNWIEKDGWTVSQVIDSKKGTVKAFWSFADETSLRGKRRSLFVDGTFAFAK